MRSPTTFLFAALLALFGASSIRVVVPSQSHPGDPEGNLSSVWGVRETIPSPAILEVPDFLEEWTTLEEVVDAIQSYVTEAGEGFTLLVVNALFEPGVLGTYAHWEEEILCAQRPIGDTEMSPGTQMHLFTQDLGGGKAGIPGRTRASEQPSNDGTTASVETVPNHLPPSKSLATIVRPPPSTHLLQGEGDYPYVIAEILYDPANHDEAVFETYAHRTVARQIPPPGTLMRAGQPIHLYLAKDDG